MFRDMVALAVEREENGQVDRIFVGGSGACRMWAEEPEEV
jgi:hypothetical protein